MRTLLALLFLSASVDAVACSCVIPARPTQQDYLEELAGADAVFVATVTSEVDVQASFDMRDQKVTLRIDERIKGSPSDLQSVTIGLCGFEFETGKKYLVYAHRDRNGELRVSVCSFSKEYAGKTRELKLLRKAAQLSSQRL